MNDRAQISAELIIVLAALLAVAVMFIGEINVFSRRASDRLRQAWEGAIREQTGIGT